MNQSTVRLLVLDGQGVVFNDPLPAFLQRLAHLTAQDPEQLRNRWSREIRRPFWTGVLEEEEMWSRLAGPGSDHDWRQLLEASYAPGPAAAHVQRWSQAVPLWLLSNHRTDWLIPRLDRFHLKPYFARILVSDALAAAKPDLEAFLPIVRAVEDPSTAILVDDHTCNVEVAARLGMRTILADTDGTWLAAVDKALF